MKKTKEFLADYLLDKIGNLEVTKEMIKNNLTLDYQRNVKLDLHFSMSWAHEEVQEWIYSIEKNKILNGKEKE